MEREREREERERQIERDIEREMQIERERDRKREWELFGLLTPVALPVEAPADSSISGSQSSTRDLMHLPFAETPPATVLLPCSLLPAGRRVKAIAGMFSCYAAGSSSGGGAGSDSGTGVGNDTNNIVADGDTDDPNPDLWVTVAAPLPPTLWELQQMEVENKPDRPRGVGRYISEKLWGVALEEESHNHHHRPTPKPLPAHGATPTRYGHGVAAGGDSPGLAPRSPAPAPASPLFTPSKRIPRRILLPFNVTPFVRDAHSQSTISPNPNTHPPQAGWICQVSLRQPFLEPDSKSSNQRGARTYYSPQGAKPDNLTLGPLPSRARALRLAECNSPPVWECKGLRKDPPGSSSSGGSGGSGGGSSRNTAGTCPICLFTFAPLRPQKHCRNCGHLVCPYCSDKVRLNPNPNPNPNLLYRPYCSDKVRWQP